MKNVRNRKSFATKNHSKGNYKHKSNVNGYRFLNICCNKYEKPLVLTHQRLLNEYKSYY